MSIESPRSRRTQKGFSLIEVLVALAIATLMIVIVAPLSRHVVRTISTIRTDLTGLALQDAVTMQTPAAIELLTKNHPEIEIRIHAAKLAPFDYGSSIKVIWQPVLRSVDVRMPDGHFFTVERIVLQREGQ